VNDVVQSWHRRDIAGLRTIAILVVVAFHAHVPGFDGGFVGVDIFYVISGFLISHMLIREVQATGKVHLLSFWAKRIRRLAPALTVMLAAVLIAGSVLLSPLELRPLLKQGLSAAFYVSNMFFARSSTDYFTGGAAAQSPFLHTWSLGVEEQFYVLWPLLLLLTAWVARRLRASFRSTLAAVLAVTIALSAFVAVWLSKQGSAYAFYSLPARAWELAAGGLLACLGPALLTRWSRGRRVASLIGLSVLIVAVTQLDDGTGYPLLVLPVVGTVLVIAGGDHRSSETNLATRLLSSAPCQLIGAWSYAWYLWHWPFVVFTVLAANHDSAGLRVLASVAAFGAAGLTYRFVENPVRFSPLLTRSLRRTYVSAAAALAAIVVLSAAVYGYQAVRLQSPLAAAARQAEATLPDHDCQATLHSRTGIEYCSDGAVSSSVTVMLIGDSHAGTWKNALAAAASNTNVHLVVRWKPYCPALDVDILAGGTRRDPSCAQYRIATSQLVDELRPEVVVMANSNDYVGQVGDGGSKPVTADEAKLLWNRAFSRTIDSLSTDGRKVAVISDNPGLSYNPLDCSTRFGYSVKRCTPDLGEATRATAALRSAEDAVLNQRPAVSTFSSQALLCSGTSCAIYQSGAFVYADDNHLSGQWTNLQIPDLERYLQDALGEE
jgi:peptidoglycan/LPS O-acetylase OafA/YrhL